MKLDLRKMSQDEMIGDPWVIEIEILGKDGEALKYLETVDEEADIEAILQFELEDKEQLVSMIEETAFGLRFRFDDFYAWQLAKQIVKEKILDSEYDGRMLAGSWPNYFYDRPMSARNCPDAEDWYSHPGIAPELYKRHWNRGDEIVDGGELPQAQVPISVYSPEIDYESSAYFPEADYEFEEEE